MSTLPLHPARKWFLDVNNVKHSFKGAKAQASSADTFVAVKCLRFSSFTIHSYFPFIYRTFVSVPKLNHNVSVPSQFMCKKTTIFKSFRTVATLQWIDSNVKIIIAHTPNAFAPESRKKSRQFFKKGAKQKKDRENHILMTTLQLLRTISLENSNYQGRSIFNF